MRDDLNSADDMNAWGSDFESQASNFDSSGDGWDSDGWNDEQNVMSQDNTWKDDWQDNSTFGNNTSSQDESWGSEDNGDGWQRELYQNQDAEYNGNVNESASNMNLGKKKVAVIIAVCCVLLALVLMVIDNTKIEKKPSKQSVSNTNQSTQGNTANTQEQQTQSSSQTQVNSSTSTLVEVPSSTKITYSNDVFEANGRVIDKLKYVQGHQLIYCIRVSLTFGSSSETVNYYCTYSAYNTVNKGDLVFITYQQVDNSYISINSITK